MGGLDSDVQVSSRRCWDLDLLGPMLLEHCTYGRNVVSNFLSVYTYVHVLGSDVFLLAQFVCCFIVHSQIGTST